MNRHAHFRVAVSALLFAFASVSLLAGCQDGSGPRLIAAPDEKPTAEGTKPQPPPANPEIAITWGGPHHGVYIMDADGSNVTSVVVRKRQEREIWQGPTWSPDGSALAYSLFWGIYVVNKDGSDNHLVLQSGKPLWEPAWSPTGTEIAVPALDDTTVEILVFPAAGGTPDTLFSMPTPGSVHLAWNHDGTKLAFAASRTILVINRATGTAVSVWTDPAAIVGIDWARQGVDTLVFSTTYSDIYTLDVSIPNQAPELLPDLSGRFPSFSPDNSKIVFKGDDEGLHTYEFTTGLVESINRGPCWYPDWLR